MGTNLSQVFIMNIGNLEAPGGNGEDSPLDLDASDVGIWSINKYGANSDNWINSKLYQTTFSPADNDTADGGSASTSLTFANPAWLFNQIQFAQGATSGNPIMSPMINTRDIRKITFDPYTAFAGTKATIVNDTLNVASAVDGDDYNFKFIIKTVPTDYLNYYDQEGLNLFVDFPLGAFNTTNHKAINMTVVVADVSDADGTGNLTAVQNALAAHPILSKMFTAADVGDDIVITAIHPGVVFDLIIQNVSQDADPVSCAITGQVLGVGNAWQVAGEEIRTRSRYANFNRMYLPQNMPLYTNSTFKYHKFVIEYEHNWPNSTGIAPAGALNQIVIYAGDGVDAMLAGDTNLDAAFALANVTAHQEFIW